MQFKVTKGNNIFNVSVQPDLKAYINGYEAKLDLNYNSVILSNGSLVDSNNEVIKDSNGIQVNGLRLNSKQMEKVLKFISEYKEKLPELVEEQKSYVPKIIELVDDQFIYDSPFEFKFAESSAIEKINLLFKDNSLLIKFVKDLLDEKNKIQTKEIIGLKQYKDYIKSLKDYEIIQKDELKSRAKFDKYISGKTAVAVKRCESCNNLVITGTPDLKFLPMQEYFSARDELSSQELKNPYPQYCEIITKNFYYVHIGDLKKCKECKI